MVDWLEIRHKIRIRKGGLADRQPCDIFVDRHTGSLVDLMQTSVLICGYPTVNKERPHTYNI